MRRKWLYGAILILGALVVLLFGLIFGWWAAKELELKNDQAKVSESSGVDQGIKVSKNYWGVVCNGQISTTFVPLEDGIAGQASSMIAQDGTRSECAVAITTKGDLSEVQICAIKVHEDGHLAGKGHSQDKTNIMYYQITDKNTPKDCNNINKKAKSSSKKK